MNEEITINEESAPSDADRVVEAIDRLTKAIERFITTRPKPEGDRAPTLLEIIDGGI